MSTAEMVEYTPAVRSLASRWLPAVAAQAAEGAEGDVVCSPAGLWLTLAAAAAGARGRTAEELRGLVGCAGPAAAAAATTAARDLVRIAGVAVSTGMWASVPLFREYREALPEVGFARLDPNRPGELSRWIRTATGGMVAAPPLPADPNGLLVLVNALTVNVDWANPFESRHTRPRPFTDARGAVHTVPTMAGSLPRPSYAWTAPGPGGGTVEVAAMLCRAARDGDPLQVSVVLGEPGRSADEVLPAAWAPQESRRPVEADQVTIALPRFALRSVLDAARQVDTLGLASAASRAADFSDLSPVPLKLGRVTQDCVLRVEEEGLRAAAVTEMTAHRLGVGTRKRVVRHLAFDRPFGLVVFEGGSGMPLFAAWQASRPRED